MTMKSILHSFNYSLDFLEEQVVDIPASDMVAQPSGVVNHPSWTIGHLTFVLQMLGGVIGIPKFLTQDWVRRFGPGSIPVADTDVYESKEESIRIFREIRRRIIEAVNKLDDLHLDRPFPDEAHRDVFPTIRHALTQVLIGHTAFHIGQLSVWRRAMGLARMKRSYE